MTLSSRFTEALQYASTIHNGQVRKGTNIPYVSHLLAVASLALEHGASEDETIAALLHDAVEDAGGLKTLDDIAKRFGKNVALIVKGCTDAHTIPKPPWRQRKTAYIEHLRQAEDSVLLVSASDKLHNARAILRDYRELGDELWRRFNASKDDELWYYRALTNVFKTKQSEKLTPLIAELDRVVLELEEMASQK